MMLTLNVLRLLFRTGKCPWTTWTSFHACHLCRAWARSTASRAPFCVYWRIAGRRVRCRTARRLASGRRTRRAPRTWPVAEWSIPPGAVRWWRSHQTTQNFRLNSVGTVWGWEVSRKSVKSGNKMKIFVFTCVIHLLAAGAHSFCPPNLYNNAQEAKNFYQIQIQDWRWPLQSLGNETSH